MIESPSLDSLPLHFTHIFSLFFHIINVIISSGVCRTNVNCVCALSSQGDPLWYGADCSLRACPHDIAWVGHVVNANDLHPRMECSNKGLNRVVMC